MIFWFLTALLILLISLVVAYWSMKSAAKEQNDIFAQNLPPQPDGGVIPTEHDTLPQFVPKTGPRIENEAKSQGYKVISQPQTIEEAKQRLESIIANDRQPTGNVSQIVSPVSTREELMAKPTQEGEPISLGKFIGAVTVKRDN